MKKDLLIKAMKTSISEVLETMFFSPLEFAHPAESGAAVLPDDPLLSARIAFNGPLIGFMRLNLPHGLAHSLTADFLGVDREAVGDRQIVEMVKELLNMFAGNTFSRFDAKAVFDLGLPEIVGPTDPMPPTSQENRIAVLGETLHGPVECELFVERDEARLLSHA